MDTGSLTITSNASTSPTTLSLSGTGMAATPTGADVSVMPTDGAVDVPVNTVIIATETGTGNLAVCFNAQTFTRSVNGSATSAATAPASPDDDECVEGGLVKGVITYSESGMEGTFTPKCRLANRAVYTATIASSPGGLSSTKTWNFATIAASPDTEDDGVPDNEDDFPGNKGKGSPPSSRGKGKFLVDVTGTTGASLAFAEGIAETSASLNRTGKPSGYEFPDGLVSYQVTDVAPGSTVTVKVTFPSGVPAGSRIYKVGTAGFQEALNETVQGKHQPLQWNIG